MNILGVQMQDKTALIIGGVVLVLGYLAVKKTGETIDALGNAINPLSNSNIFYKGTNSIGAAITGESNFSLGVWLYDALHPNESNGGNAIKQPTSSSGVTGSW